MITKIWFKRTEQNEPVICLASDAPEGVVQIDTFLITEELYDQWVPDTVRTEYHVARREDGVYRIPNHVGTVARVIG